MNSLGEITHRRYKQIELLNYPMMVEIYIEPHVKGLR